MVFACWVFQLRIKCKQRMSRDYKNRATATKKRRPARKKQQQHHQPLPWLWFLGGVLVTALAFAGYLAMQAKPVPLSSEKDKVALIDKPKTGLPKSSEKQPQTPQFEFYSVLPEMEVEIPPDQLHPSAAPVKKSSEIYQLQLGSYRSMDDAKRMEASLGLIGIAAHIERVTINDKTHYRVRSGPYTREQVYSLHTRLQSHSVESQILKVKKK